MITSLLLAAVLGQVPGPALFFDAPPSSQADPLEELVRRRCEPKAAPALETREFTVRGRVVTIRGRVVDGKFAWKLAEQSDDVQALWKRPEAAPQPPAAAPQFQVQPRYYQAPAYYTARPRRCPPGVQCP